METTLECTEIRGQWECDTFEEKIIKLRYISGKGWRIDEP
jgi:hypothetical protein